MMITSCCWGAERAGAVGAQRLEVRKEQNTRRQGNRAGFIGVLGGGSRLLMMVVHVSTHIKPSGQLAGWLAG
jgi:hypothetical protein